MQIKNEVRLWFLLSVSILLYFGGGHFIGIYLDSKGISWGFGYLIVAVPIVQVLQLMAKRQRYWVELGAGKISGFNSKGNPVVFELGELDKQASLRQSFVQWLVGMHTLHSKNGESICINVHFLGPSRVRQLFTQLGFPENTSKAYFTRDAALVSIFIAGAYGLFRLGYGS